MITEKMDENDNITQIMLGMVDTKARELYSETLVEYGTNPTNYGVLSAPDGYAKITGT